MLSSLKQKWKWPIGYWFVDKIKSNVQAQLIRIAITQCDKFGINVVAVTCDGAYANSSTFKTLGCDRSPSLGTHNRLCLGNTIAEGKES